jgi:uncharacterized protein
MLKVNLAGLDREEARLEARVPTDDPFWEGTRLRPVAPLTVQATAHLMGDDVLVRGRIQAEVEMDCRRCLVPVTRRVDDTVDMLFVEVAEAEDEVDGEVYPLPVRGTVLDLTDAVREQLLLRVPEYALCREGCRGLCPSCGTNLNEGACDCVQEAPPTPWDALKQVKFD